METTVEQSELFPLLSNSTTSKRPFREWFETFIEHGPLMTPTLAAAGMGVSRQRVHQLVNEGRIATVVVNGERFIPATAVELFMSEEKSLGGRPSRLKERFKTALADRRQDRAK